MRKRKRYLNTETLNSMKGRPLSKRKTVANILILEQIQKRGIKVR